MSRTLSWEGLVLEAHTPAPTAARVFAEYVSGDTTERLAAAGELIEILLPGQAGEVYEQLEYSGGDLARLLEMAVRASSGRTFRSVASLCMAAVQSWGVIRGRLVHRGIPDPLRQLPTLWALIDAVEAMIIEGKDSEEAVEEYWREATREPLTVDTDPEAPPDWW